MRGVTRGAGGVCAMACDVMHGTRDGMPRDGVAVPFMDAPPVPPPPYRDDVKCDTLRSILMLRAFHVVRAARRTVAVLPVSIARNKYL